MASGRLYLAVVVDVFSRRVVGWSMAGSMKAGLVVDALDMAVRRRRPKAVIHHSDQGSQYTSGDFARRCKAAGVVRSTGSVGDCHGNAMCESFFATLECGLLARRRFAAASEARPAVFGSVEGWYNPRRRHSAIAYRSPVAYEQAAGGWCPRCRNDRVSTKAGQLQLKGNATLAGRMPQAFREAITELRELT